MTRPDPPRVVPVERDGRSGFAFACGACGRRSALFSLRESAEAQARAHAKDRCKR